MPTAISYAWVPHPTEPGHLMTQDALDDLAQELGVTQDRIKALAWWPTAGEPGDSVEQDTLERFVREVLKVF